LSKQPDDADINQSLKDCREKLIWKAEKAEMEA
jgi:hypothetical protein